MELQGKRIAVFVDSLYQEMEVWVPVYRFREAGAEVVLAAAEARTYTSKLGYPAVARQTYDELDPAAYHGVVVPGGYAPDYIRRYSKALDFVRALDRDGKLIASICHGPWVLCSAGVLRNRRATCYFAIKDDVVNAGAVYEDADVVVDANLVTSRKPDDLPAFCRASIQVVSALK
jgi:protease I